MISFITKTSLPWIEIGYSEFALHGETGITIELLAKKLKKSKSSFYHNFANRDIFIDVLLDYHLTQGSRLAEKEKKCNTLVPELIEVLIEHKTDILFHRQLRINRHIQRYNACLERLDEEAEKAVLRLWSQELGLEWNSDLSAMLLRFSLENFFLQLTEHTMNIEWMSQYMEELKSLFQGLRKSERKSIRR